MRRRSIFTVGELVAAHAGLFLAATVLAQHPGDDPCHDDLCGKAHAARFVPNGAFDPRHDGQSPREAITDTDLLHCDLDVEVFPANGSIAGSNTMRLRSSVDGLNEFTFRLRQNMNVTAVTLNGTTNIPLGTVSLVNPDGRRFALDRSYNLGEEFTVRVDYNGTPQSLGFGSYTNVTVNGQPLVSTLSEPYYAASWWPCKDGAAQQPGDNHDKFTLNFAITAPSSMRTVSNGLLEGIDALPNARSRYRWVSNYPITSYLVAFCSTAYNTWTESYTHANGAMPVEFNIFPFNDSPTNRTAWGRSVTMLGTFRPLFGEYPFINEKYGIYNFTFGGGMEHQTNTGQGTFSESVTAHELGHQWWGDMITCRTWHDIWLNESFATYSEALWHENKPGSSGYQAYINHMWNRRPDSLSDTVYVYDTTNVGRIFSTSYTYRKGAWVLHSLRHELGDALFFQAIANYRAAFEFSAATTDDFATIVSATAGRDMTYFFEQWIYQGGAPDYRFAWQPATIDGGNYVRVYLAQAQAGTVQAFNMPVDVRITTSGGDFTAVVRNDARAEHFLIPIPGTLNDVTIDPLDWILVNSKSTVAWVNGPPKIVRTTPTIDAAIPPTQPITEVAIAFSEDVAATPADFSITGPAGAVPFTLNYSAATFVATLSLQSALPAGNYLVTASDSVQSVAAAISLDGEIDALAPALPSGEGLPGGNAGFGFRVRPACPADLNGDEAVELADLAILLAHFGQTEGATPAEGDLDGDGGVTLQDLAIFLANFGVACG